MPNDAKKKVTHLLSGLLSGSSFEALGEKYRGFFSNWQGIMLVVISATGFSTLGILGKVAYANGLNLPSILAFRFLGTAVILWTWLLLRGRFQVTLDQAIKAILLGAIGYAVQASLFFSALMYTGAGIATLLLYMYPAFVTLLAWIVEKEVPNRYGKAALGIALLGCTLTADLSQATVAPLGVMFGIAAGVWYSLYLTFGARLVRSIDPVVATAYVSLGATFSFLTTAVVTGQFTIPESVEGLRTILGITVLATAIPIVTLFAGIQKIGITKAAIVSTVEPMMSVLLGIIFLGEYLEGVQILGGLMVVCSVILANL